MSYLHLGTILTIFLTSYQSLPVDASAFLISTPNNTTQEDCNTPTQTSTSTSNAPTQTTIQTSTITPSNAPIQRTLAPSNLLTQIPTRSPINDPTTEPSNVPTRIITLAPPIVPTTEPNIALTVKPSVSPSNTHTHTLTTAPIKAPSTAPSNTPTPSPTSIPSSEPTMDCFFRDDWTFNVNEQPGRGCGWIRNNLYERCLWSTGAKQACAQTCCGINDTIAEPSKLPTAPTLSPSNAPTPKSTLTPSIAPINAPTLTPTQTSTIAPSNVPTKIPTLAPSSAPTQTLTITPSNTPTQIPTTSTSTAPTETFRWWSDAPTYLSTLAPTKGYNPLERLRYKSLPITTSPGGRCMDGTMAGYYIREGNDPNVFVINMKGGGHCTDPVRCADRARSKKGSSRYFPGSMKGTDFLDSNCARNPRFCHATHVHIPYCTSDMHRGTSEPSNDGLWHSQYYFDGHSNFMAIVDRLILAEGLKNSSNMKVLLVGNSAGAVGVYFNIDKLKERIPLAVVKGVPVAGWLPIGALEDDLPPIYKPSNFTMFVAGLRGNPFYQFIQNGGVPIDFYQMKGSLPADCLDDYNENEWWACAGMNQAYRYIKAPLFHVHTLYDNTQIYDPQNGGTPKDPVSFSDIHNVKQYIGMIGRATRAGLQQVLGNTTNLEKNQTDGIFAASCLSHGTEYAVTIDGGYNWQDIVTDWFFENGRLTDYHRQVELCTNEDDYELPCNSNVSCKYRPSMLVETCKQAMANNGCLNETGTEQCLKCVKRFRRSILGAGCSPLRKAEVIIPEICEDANSVNRSQ